MGGSVTVRRIGAVVALAGAGVLIGCSAGGKQIAVYQPPAGSNQVLNGPIAAAPGHSLVMGDLVMEAGGTIPRHYHAGEEFLYVLGGSATVYREGEAAMTLEAGQGVRIAPGTVHWGAAGAHGVRAVSSWVAVDGQPLRVAVPE
jgi:quercetin dioxygenase-like cupin family protein